MHIHTADGRGSRPLPRPETKKRHKYRTFDQGISKRRSQKHATFDTTDYIWQLSEKTAVSTPRHQRVQNPFILGPSLKSQGRKTGQQRAGKGYRSSYTSYLQCPPVCLSDSVQDTACLEPLLGEKVSYLGPGDGVPAAGEK